MITEFKLINRDNKCVKKIGDIWCLFIGKSHHRDLDEFESNFINSAIEATVAAMTPKPKVVESSQIPTGFDYHESFFHSASYQGQEEAEKFMEGLGMDLYDEGLSPCGNYFICFETSGHERDSSGDHINVYKKA